jgi:hypothetical protein
MSATSALKPIHPTKSAKPSNGGKVVALPVTLIPIAHVALKLQSAFSSVFLPFDAPLFRDGPEQHQEAGVEPDPVRYQGWCAEGAKWYVTCRHLHDVFRPG